MHRLIRISETCFIAIDHDGSASFQFVQDGYVGAIGMPPYDYSRMTDEEILEVARELRFL